MIKLLNLNIKKVIFGFILLSLVFFTLFVPDKYSKEILTLILVIYTLISFPFLKKAKAFSIDNKKIFIQMMAFACIYVMGMYFIGIYTGFYKNPVTFNVKIEIKYIIISIIVIVLSELIRYMLVSKKDKFSTIFVTISLILIDIILYAQIYDITRLNDFLTVLGLIVFASTAENLLFNYICMRFGYKPVIIYRLITVLYIYTIPILPEIYTYFRSIIKIIYPYLIFLFFEGVYPSEKKIVSRFSKSKKIILSLSIIAFGVVITMLISCRFYIGIISVGSNSMKNAINMGDAIIFVKYTDQDLKIGDIIVFEKNNMRIIHRIVEIQNVNNENRYITKGDNNDTNDLGYITNVDIIGVSKLRLNYIGYPSILLGNFFDSIKR